jgi:hypothetical protein
MSLDVTREAACCASFGIPGSGKSHFIKDRLRREQPTALLVFDLEGEYTEFGYATSDPAELVRAVQHPHFSVIFRPADSPRIMRQQFEAVAMLSWSLVKTADRPHTFVVDELHQVTSPSWCPDPWETLVTRGRKWGATLYTGAQRPAMIDKATWSLANEIRAGNLGYAEDQRMIASKISCDPAEIGALQGHDYLHWVQGQGIVARPTFRPAGRPKVAGAK